MKYKFKDNMQKYFNMYVKLKSFNICIFSFPSFQEVPLEMAIHLIGFDKLNFSYFSNFSNERYN
jgi:hypothetical protein